MVIAMVTNGRPGPQSLHLLRCQPARRKQTCLERMPASLWVRQDGRLSLEGTRPIEDRGRRAPGTRGAPRVVVGAHHVTSGSGARVMAT